MVHHVKCLSKVQEDHSASQPLVRFLIQEIKKIHKASQHGVTLPEPRLAGEDDIMFSEMTV